MLPVVLIPPRKGASRASNPDGLALEEASSRFGGSLRQQSKGTTCTGWSGMPDTDDARTQKSDSRSTHDKTAQIDNGNHHAPVAKHTGEHIPGLVEVAAEGLRARPSKYALH
jgi:hypothetical protein